MYTGSRRASWQRSPHPHDLLVHACIHFAWSHAMSSGGWRPFRDVQALAAAGGIDWPEAAATAVRRRAASCCYWTLRLARALSGVGVADDVLAAVRPPGGEPLHRLLERHFALTLVKSRCACPSVRVRRKLWEAGIRPRWSGHAAARPWRRTHAAPPRAAETTDEAGGGRLAHHFAQVPAWTTYARTVLIERGR